MPKILSGLNSLVSDNSNNSSFKNEIFSARVRYVILDDKTEPNIFKKYGEWSSIGSLFFSRINNPNPDNSLVTDNFAKPLFPNNKLFPLKNEIVYIISLPSSEIQGDVNSINYYYFQPVNIWNSVHHNAIPDPINGNSIPISQQHDYLQTEIGTVRRVTNNSTEINLGNTFKEKINIKNIQPFEGDIIYEGRWGQNIRFGSTVKNSNIFNPWSKSGTDGDPLIIIKNGQYDDGKDAWIPQVEDINKDKSSIYLTSTQSIPIEVSSNNYNSYTNSPISTDKFIGEQIILNSGRLLFNSKNDSILLSSKKTINLNSQESVNIDTKKFIVNSPSVLLGGKEATESIILGDTFLSDMSQLLTKIIELSIALPSVGTTTPFVPNIDVGTAATELQVIAESMLNRIENFKSKISKTK
jgi:hypothetical protein